ncbi:MarR family transcriptional regulator [Eubacteriaceae bacterium ES3]|nr:MarR family transcriptional regulator [Eubacteriaceae bacterium ES3]
MENLTYGKLVAIINQKGLIYYERQLSQYGIGWGQYFVLLVISQNPGITILELAKKTYLDQSTVTRSLKKLSEEEYISVEISESDRRVREIYSTEKAKPVIEAILIEQKNWNEQLVTGMNQEETQIAYELLKKIADNSISAVKNLCEEGKINDKN